jgi:hypothetical protein
MEVHHHTHHPKKWNEYFWEFFMLFLAVFCGFLAEIQVEHYVEHQREEKYMISLKEELGSDTALYAQSMKSVLEIQPLLDSFYFNLTRAADYQYIIKGKWNVYVNEKTVTYLPALTTILQIKNSGNLRLIKNDALLQEVIKYESMVTSNYGVIAQTVQNAKEKVYLFEDDYCDYKNFSESLSMDINNKTYKYTPDGAKYDMPLLTRDPVILNRFANSIVNYKGRLRGYQGQLVRTKEQAEKLIKMIIDEYHLK